jgi:phytoene dehydrogenase-like protein
METYDAIFIGSGHNALIAAAYLARAGWSVLVLERNDRPGGLVRTEALTLPGFQHDTFSSAHPLFVSGPAYAELGPELEARGLRYVNTDLPVGVSLPDGRTAVYSRDLSASIAEAERLSPGDGAAWGELMGAFFEKAGAIFPLFGQDLSSPESLQAIRSLMLSAEGTGLSPFAADFLLSARDVLEPRFKSEAWKGMLAPWVLHLGRGPEDANGGFWLPTTFAAVQGGGMPIPVGGSGMLARALARLVEDHKGVIRTGAEVERVIVEGGKAQGVRLKGGEVFAARRVVVANANPDQIYLKLLQGVPEVPVDVKRQAARYRYGRGCVQIQLALSAPLRWPDERLGRGGMHHLTPGLDGLSRSVNEAARGLLPVEPTIAIDSPTVLDPSRAPAGKAIARVQILDVPRAPRGDAAGKIEVGDGTWTAELKERFTDRVLDLCEKHVPGLKQSILAKHVISPAEIARFNPNCGSGDPYGGAHDLAQSYLFGPIVGQPSHRTVVPRLLSLGASTWPGHGVNGGSGYIVAKHLLKMTA